jgi:diguanylate cyclase
MLGAHPHHQNRFNQILIVSAAVLEAMRLNEVLPTPHAYAVWYSHCSGSNHGLSARIQEMIAQKQPFGEDAIEALHHEWIVGVPLDIDLVASHAESLGQAAQSLLDHVAGSRDAAEGYSSTLENWGLQLHTAKATGVILEGFARLTSETSAALIRNRELERQLSSATGRISKLQHSLTTVKQEATTDALTGIPNRRAFDERLRRLTNRARIEAIAPTALMMIDIDHFKRFNDQHGHTTGDLVLRLVGKMLAENVKGRDMAARYGGEEFAILLDGADLVGAHGLASKLCKMLSSKSLTNKRSQQALGNVTISIGVTQHRHGDTAASLIDRADAALYRAKQHGRNQACTDLEVLAELAMDVAAVG